MHPTERSYSISIISMWCQRRNNNGILVSHGCCWQLNARRCASNPQLKKKTPFHILLLVAQKILISSKYFDWLLLHTSLERTCEHQFSAGWDCIQTYCFQLVSVFIFTISLSLWAHIIICIIFFSFTPSLREQTQLYAWNWFALPDSVGRRRPSRRYLPTVVELVTDKSWYSLVNTIASAESLSKLSDFIEWLILTWHFIASSKYVAPN